MDLSKYDTNKAANTGRFMHLEFLGEPLYTDDKQKVGLFVKGTASAEFKGREKKLREAQLERVRLGRNGKVRGLSLADEEQRELYASLVTSYVNVTLDGKKLPESADLQTTIGLFERFRWLQEQVMAFVEDEANFLGES